MNNKYKKKLKKCNIDYVIIKKLCNLGMLKELLWKREVPPTLPVPLPPSGYGSKYGYYNCDYGLGKIHPLISNISTLRVFVQNLTINRMFLLACQYSVK